MAIVANAAQSRMAIGVVTSDEAHAIGFQRGTLAVWN